MSESEAEREPTAADFGLVLERLVFVVSQDLQREMVKDMVRDFPQVAENAAFEVSDSARWFSDLIATRLRTSFYGGLKDQVSVHIARVPLDWWQAVRERFAPRWWLRRYPVKERWVRTETPMFIAVCPHLGMPQVRHLGWLAEQRKVFARPDAPPVSVCGRRLRDEPVEYDEDGDARN